MMTGEFDGKKILIWGYGREGKSTEAFLKRTADPSVIDIYEGDLDGIDRDAYDVIFKSPGIRMDEDDKRFISQTEVFLQAYRDRTIGITGTKGKSTTSTFMYNVLKECLDRPVVLLGNIGIPCLDYYNEISSDTIVVFEMSAHQLRNVSVSPHISVFLNLYEEHLDYYDTMEKYFAAKAHIAFFQKKEDYLYVGENVPYIETKANTTVMSYSDPMEFDLMVPGLHNRYNAQIVYMIATDRFGCDPEKVRYVLSHTKGLPHRLEYIGSKGEVTYYDDSISTIPEAAISALESIPDARTILIGGMDRGIEYDKLIRFILEHSEYNYICMYASGKRIYDTDVISSLPYTFYEEDLESAVRHAEKITDRGAIVLSPAAASYDHFKNFEERGNCFRKLIVIG